MTNRLILIVTLAMVLGSCGGGRTFTSGQLGGFMLVQSDVPNGLQLVPEASGAQTIDQVADTDEERTKLSGLHFQGSNAATFVNQSAIALLSNQPGPTDDAELVGSAAIVFKTADGAHQALAYEHERDLIKGTNVKTISVPKLGDETIGEQGTQESLPFPGYIIFWRVGNTIFALIIAGGSSADISLDKANALAQIVNDRANK